MGFQNSYGDDKRAQAYNELTWEGTYCLVSANLPRLLRKYACGKQALDFGCGTGRSSRLIKGLGFEVTGVDISENMVAVARQRDKSGEYQVISDGDFSLLGENKYDLILSAFTFDNIPERSHKLHLFKELGNRLNPDGVLVSIVSTPEMYLHEWVTFTTSAFTENKNAKCGDIVKIITTDYSDNRPVDDILWPDEDYQSVYLDAGLQQIYSEAPLAKGDEDINWKSETEVAPWRIYILKRA